MATSSVSMSPRRCRPSMSFRSRLRWLSHHLVVVRHRQARSRHSRQIRGRCRHSWWDFLGGLAVLKCFKWVVEHRELERIDSREEALHLSEDCLDNYFKVLLEVQVVKAEASHHPCRISLIFWIHSWCRRPELRDQDPRRLHRTSRIPKVVPAMPIETTSRDRQMSWQTICLVLLETRLAWSANKLEIDRQTGSSHKHQVSLRVLQLNHNQLVLQVLAVVQPREVEVIPMWCSCRIKPWFVLGKFAIICKDQTLISLDHPCLSCRWRGTR